MVVFAIRHYIRLPSEGLIPHWEYINLTTKEVLMTTIMAIVSAKILFIIGFIAGLFYKKK